MKISQALTLIVTLSILPISTESANAKPLTKTYPDGLTVDYYPKTNVTVLKVPNSTEQRTQGSGQKITLPIVKSGYETVTVRGCSTRMIGSKTIYTCY